MIEHGCLKQISCKSIGSAFDKNAFGHVLSHGGGQRLVRWSVKPSMKHYNVFDW
jgi:hypothetical protein